MLRVTFRSLLSRKLRLLLSGMAIVLGVAFVAGSFVLTDTIGRSFDAMMRTAYSADDVLVIGQSDTELSTELATELIPASVLEQVRQLPGVREADGLVMTDGARVVDNRTGRVITTYGAPRFGGNWWGEDEVTQLREGRGPAADHEVIVNAHLASLGRISVGDQIEVLTREPARTFTVVGIWGYAGGRDSLFGETGVAFTTPVAQQLMLGQLETFNELSLLTTEDVTPAQLRDTVQAELGDDYLVRTAEEASDEASDVMQEALGFFNKILLGFAGVALFVGVFLVLNTFSIIVAQRLRELALLRAIGASKGQVIASVLLEATLIGSLASVVGLGLGIGVGALLALAVSWLFGGAPLAGIGVPAAALISSVAVGLLVTLVAALIPAVRAARVPPIAALQQAAGVDRPLTKLTLAGAVTTAAGIATLALTLTGAFGLPGLLAGVLLVFVGVSLLIPVIARPVVSALGRMFAWSTPGELGRRNTGRNPRRTAITAAALMVGVALVTTVSTIFSSLTTSTDRLLADDLQADLIIAGEQFTAMPPVFDAQVLTEARQLPEVAAVTGFWLDLVELPGGNIIQAVDDVTAWQKMVGTQPVEGSLDTLRRGQVLVDDRTAEQQGLTPGDLVPINLPRGDETDYTVVGIYQRKQLLAEGYLLSSEEADGFRSPQPVQGMIALREDALMEPVRDKLDQLLADSPEVLLQDLSSYADQQTAVLDQVLIFVQVLLLLAMGIAVLGVINTLVLSMIERTRELGLLRAVGLSRAATMRMITVEAVVISIFGALLGIGVGAGLGAATVQILRDDGLTHLSLPWGLMIAYLIVAGLVGVVAALIPAIRAARLNVLGAIGYE